MSFTQKALAVDFSLSQGQFKGGGNSYTAKGLRMSARITTPGGEDAGNLELAIFGMTLSEMNALTVLPTAATAVGQNTVTVRAGDGPNPSAVVFNGTIVLAYVDGSRQPDVCFHVVATGGQVEKIKPVPAVSLPGSQDVATLMGQLAQGIGRTLENNGVDSKVQNPNLPGSGLQQISALARHAGIEWTLEKDTVAIWKPGQARQGATVQISKRPAWWAIPPLHRAASSSPPSFRVPSSSAARSTSRAAFSRHVATGS